MRGTIRLPRIQFRRIDVPPAGSIDVYAANSLVGKFSSAGFVGDVSGGVKLPVAAYGADGALTLKSGVAILTKATAGAYTLAAPAATTDGGKILYIVASTAQAHTVTQATPGFNGGGASSDVATFGGAAGDSLMVVAYNGVWYVLNARNVTIA